MKRAWMTPVAAAGLVVSMTVVSLAQAPDPSRPTNPAHVEHPSNTTKQNSDSATKPENMGTSGWTGGRQDATPQSETTGAGPGAGHADTPGNINNDSSYATGEDLKGGPAQFPANKTPE